MGVFLKAAAGCGVLAALLMGAGGAVAQDSDVFNSIGGRLGAVERQVSAGLRLTKPDPLVQPAQFGGGGSSSAASAAQLSARLDAVEGHMRTLTGQIEQLMFQVRQIDERMKRSSEELPRETAGAKAAGAAAPAGAPSGAPPRPRVEVVPVTPVPPPPSPPTATVQPAQGTSPGLATPPQTLGQVSGRPMDLAAGPRVVPDVAPGASGTPGTAAVMAPSATPRDEYDLAYGFILRQDHEMAEEGFRGFLARYPNDGLAGNATFYLGESYFAQAKYREAADSYLKVYTSHAQNVKAADSLIKLGASLRLLKENEAACAALGEFGKRFPKAPSGLRAQLQAEQQRAGCS